MKNKRINKRLKQENQKTFQKVEIKKMRYRRDFQDENSGVNYCCQRF